MAVGRDGQDLIRAEGGRKRKDATPSAANAARMHRTLMQNRVSVLNAGPHRQTVHNTQLCTTERSMPSSTDLRQNGGSVRDLPATVRRSA